jgi:hypothetical protein
VNRSDQKRLLHEGFLDTRSECSDTLANAGTFDSFFAPLLSPTRAIAWRRPAMLVLAAVAFPSASHAQVTQTALDAVLLLLTNGEEGEDGVNKQTVERKAGGWFSSAQISYEVFNSGAKKVTLKYKVVQKSKCVYEVTDGIPGDVWGVQVREYDFSRAQPGGVTQSETRAGDFSSRVLRLRGLKVCFKSATGSANPVYDSLAVGECRNDAMIKAEAGRAERALAFISETACKGSAF